MRLRMSLQKAQERNAVYSLQTAHAVQGACAVAAAGRSRRPPRQSPLAKSWRLDEYWRVIHSTPRK